MAEGVGGTVPLILALGVVNFMPRPLYPRRRAPAGVEPPGTHWIGAWVGAIARLDILEKRKFLSPAGIQTPNRPARS